MSKSSSIILVKPNNLAIYKHYGSQFCRNCKSEFKIGDKVFRGNKRSSKKYCMKCATKLRLV